MATLILSASASTLGLSGFSLFAANLAATAVGTFIDSRLFGVDNNSQQGGPRLNDLRISTSSEGGPINRLYGRSRVAGNLIWVTNFSEVESSKTDSSGGKGGGSNSKETTAYSYTISAAFAFTEGNSRTTIGRIWADNRLLETSDLKFRFYKGSATQNPDPKIASVEGIDKTPSFRGISYIVFEDLPLEKFGNRIPQITAEIIVPIDNPDVDILENLIKGINLIPASGEVSYGTTPQVKDDGFGNAVAENIHLKADETDFSLSIQDMTTSLPNNEATQLVISWFGTDLRMNHCDIEPRVEVTQNKILEPNAWSVGGQSRSQTTQVSRVDGRPAFGGTPSDTSIVEAITYLCNEHNQKLYFYPFLLMDIPSGNSMGQSVYPWRGRISVSSTSVDKTSAARAEIDSFFGSASVSDFSVDGVSVTYTGTEKSWRRMVLHYALLCTAVAKTLTDPSKFACFYVGTEMRGITRTRSAGVGVYPGVEAFNTLINDVKGIFTTSGLTVEVSYAADWSEYHSHRPSDGTGDVFFNMDAIWTNPNCAFIAIDNYMPISDWREGQTHADYGSGNDIYGNPKATIIYDKDYLQGQVEGGENYHYYYASQSDRENQVRSAITDGAYNEHWIFRQKDIRGWWSNTHLHRPGGVQSTASSWSPGMKRIVFSEFGCPAVDKGTNQPNVFYDPKSSESFLPHFSVGRRDDQIMRAYYETTIRYWRDNSPAGMISPDDMFAWTWDARPYPAFPFRLDVWSDGGNWTLGHWLNGRVGAVPLGELVKLICAWVGVTDIDVSGLVGTNTVVRGYVVDNMMSPREALNPLFSAYLFDGFETGGQLKFLLRANTGFSTISIQDFVSDSENPAGYQITRAQETELPQATRVSYIDEDKDYQPGSTGAQRQTTTSYRAIEIRYPIVLSKTTARTLSEIILQESWAARESFEFNLPPSKIAFDPGDGILVSLSDRDLSFRMTSIEKGEFLEVRSEGMDTTIYDPLISGAGRNNSGKITVYGKTILHFLDLPVVTGEETHPWAARVAVYQGPFPPAVNLYEDTGSDLVLNTQMFSASQIGVLVTPLSASPHTIIDEGNIIQVDMNDPDFQVLGDTEENVRNGSNAIAIQTTTGWEVLKYVTSSLQFGRRYNLGRLFRGQLGTYPIMENPIPAGRPVVFLTRSSLGILKLPEERKFDTIDWRYGPNTFATGSAFYHDKSHTGRAVGQLPYAVADVTFTLSGLDVIIEWKRQTRFGGEGFENSIVPLNEDTEKYEIDFLNSSGILLSTITTLVPTYTYTAAPSMFIAKIYQMSASVGRGRAITKQYGV